VAGKVIELGFNSVFGGAESALVRAALDQKGIGRFVEVPLFVGKSYWDKDPKTRPVTRDGSLLESAEWYYPICPNQDWVRAEKLTNIIALMEDEKPDGIWLDFIRFPVYWEQIPPNFRETCFCDACLNKFQTQSRLKVPGDTVTAKADWILREHSKEWYRWRADMILEMIDMVVSEVRKQNPGILVGAFVIPWEKGEYEEALYRVAGQDIDGIGKRVNVLSPMVYFQQLGKPMAWIGKRVADLNLQVECPILPIMQCFDKPGPLSSEELSNSLVQGMATPSRGVILFSQRHLETGKHWEVVQKQLRSP
jgi:hypothetical protein